MFLNKLLTTTSCIFIGNQAAFHENKRAAITMAMGTKFLKNTIAQKQTHGGGVPYLKPKHGDESTIKTTILHNKVHVL